MSRSLPSRRSFKYWRDTTISLGACVLVVIIGVIISVIIDEAPIGQAPMFIVYSLLVFAAFCAAMGFVLQQKRAKEQRK